MMQVNDLARIIHNTNREIQKFTGEEVNPEWDDCPEWMKQSTVEGILGVILLGNTPEKSHEQWSKTRLDAGWVWGEVKDIENKIHPCLVPYAALPPIQKAKDSVFVGLVNAFKGIVELPEH